jgi:hypothetical protein
MGPRRLALAACLAVGAAGCAPSIDPAAQADLERHLSQIQTSEETFPPSESYSPMAFVVGQWTEHRITDDRGRKSLVTTKLIGQEDGAYSFEVVNETPEGREAAKMVIAMPGGRDPAGMEIRSLVVKKGKELPVIVDPGSKPEVRAKYRAALDLFATALESQEKDDVRVPGGHFIGCYVVETAGAWGPWKVPAEICTHPSVPLSGIVRAQPIGGTGLLELVGFGVTGAESEMFQSDARERAR